MRRFLEVVAGVFLGLGAVGAFAASASSPVLNGSWCYPETNSRIVVEGESGIVVDSMDASLVGATFFRFLGVGEGETYRGEIYSPSRRRYYEARFTLRHAELDVVVRAGIFSRRFAFERCDP